jgi:pimeloyl-ACP methyl ester carboxylesterase
VLAAVVLAGGLCLGVSPDDIDAAFARFWSAKDPNAAARAAGDIVKSGASFDEVYARLRKGRAYASSVPTGLVPGRRTSLAGELAYTLEIPPGYDPSRKYQVRFQLHGGVGRPASTTRRPAGIGRLAGDEQIYILPQAWNEAPWWSETQLENLRAILDTVKRTYNVDENRVVVSGVSDGGTGAYYVAMRDPTPYASFIPLNGYLGVLANESIRGLDELFPGNLWNRPLFVVNGGRDPLYPASAVEPSLEQLRKGGVQIVYQPQPQAGHDTSWWPQVKDSFEAFVREHPRVPLPDRLTWETANTHSSGRIHWLSIDSLGSRPGEAQGQGQVDAVFSHKSRSGRVDLQRNGNKVEATTRGVVEFTLLVSSDQFDFAQPVKVTTNGQVAFEGRVEKNVATLMKWAARDNDRTMLFAAEVKVRVR